MADHEGTGKTITRREFLKRVGVAAAGAAGLGLGARGLVDAAYTRDVTRYGEAKIGPMAKTVRSEKSGLTFGYMTAEEMAPAPVGRLVGGNDIYVSADGKVWYFTNIHRRSPDSATGELATIAVYDAIIGPTSGDVYFLFANSASLGYKDTRSGAGFIRDPNKLEVVRAKGTELSVVGDFTGGSEAEQRLGFLNLVNKAEGK